LRITLAVGGKEEIWIVDKAFGPGEAVLQVQ